MKFWIAWFNGPNHGGGAGEFHKAFANDVSYQDQEFDNIELMHVWANQMCRQRAMAGEPARYVFSEYGKLDSHVRSLGWSEPEVDHDEFA